MSKICLMDGTGHTEVAEWMPGNASQMAIAEGAFNKLKAEGHAAFALKGGQTEGVIDRFDPLADEITFLRPFAGG